jgi:nucleolar MIF4G domain-containing protein 1
MFLKELMVQIFIDSQVGAPVIGSDLKVPTTRNRGAVEQIFIKATRNQTLAMGLVYFMSETFRDVMGDDDDMAKLTRWASEVAKDTLRTGVDIIPTL